MFRPEDILLRLRERPFRPLRFIVSEGLRYEIRHPDLVFVGLRDLMIGHDLPEFPGLYDRVTRVALIHIVGIEDLIPAPSEANGAAG